MYDSILNCFVREILKISRKPQSLIDKTEYNLQMHPFEWEKIKSNVKRIHRVRWLAGNDGLRCIIKRISRIIFFLKYRESWNNIQHECPNFCNINLILALTLRFVL